VKTKPPPLARKVPVIADPYSTPPTAPSGLGTATPVTPVANDPAYDPYATPPPAPKEVPAYDPYAAPPPAPAAAPALDDPYAAPPPAPPPSYLDQWKSQNRGATGQ
jgi:hypothetical protein